MRETRTTRMVDALVASPGPPEPSVAHPGITAPLAEDVIARFLMRRAIPENVAMRWAPSLLADLAARFGSPDRERRGIDPDYTKMARAALVAAEERDDA